MIWVLKLKAWLSPKRKVAENKTKEKKKTNEIKKIAVHCIKEEKWQWKIEGHVVKTDGQNGEM
jgi:hypothetical protein